MKRIFSRLISDKNDIEWLLLKLSLSLLWVDVICHTSINSKSVLYPSGLCRLVNCNMFLTPSLNLIVSICAITLAVIYVFEKQMKITILLMFLLSLLVFSIEESNGILMRCGLYTMVYFAQLVAYIRNTNDLKSERLQFAVQVITAGYFLAAISKLRQSGLAWVSEAPLASIQIMKSYCGYYFDSGEIQQLEKGGALVDFVLKHALFVKLLFGFSLFLELFAWVSLKSKTSTLVVGLMLLFMHIGIYYFMHILIVSVFYPMLVCMVNPLYWLYLFVQKTWKCVV